MRTLFMGTGEIALPSFRMMVEEGGLVGLVTQPDRPVGRSSRPRPPEIKSVAADAGIQVLQPEKIRTGEGLPEISELDLVTGELPASRPRLRPVMRRAE